jgi:hypothetical protein
MTDPITSRATIPGDDLGRSWTRARFDGLPNHEESCFVTLIAADEDDKLVVLGNAFVVSAQGSSAICLTAAHCFEEAKKHQRTNRVGAHPSLPVDFLPRVPSYIKTDGIGALYLAPSGPVACRVGQVVYIGNYDTAVCIVHSPGGARLFERNLALHLRMPAVGDRVGVLAHRIEVENLGDGQATLSRNMDLCIGVVTAIHLESSTLGQMFSFETTIPFPAGMSGGPIVWDPAPGRSVAACGLVSSDSSSTFTDFYEPARSTASMIWPAMGFGLRIQGPGQTVPNFAFLAELVGRGIIMNQSDGVLVTARRAPPWNEIRYIDVQQTPPVQCGLRIQVQGEGAAQ